MNDREGPRDDTHPEAIDKSVGEPSDTASDLPLVWHLFGDGAVLPRLLLLAKMLERETSRQLQSEFKMSVAQWRVLAFVCISGAATAAFIGESAEVDQAEVSRAVRALAERGLVTRAFEAGSRKKRTISPTPAGLEQFRDIRQSRQTYFARISTDVGAGYVVQLDRNLHQLAKRVVEERKSDELRGATGTAGECDRNLPRAAATTRKRATWTMEMRPPRASEPR